jgi:glucose 1-dehydrogenase
MPGAPGSPRSRPSTDDDPSVPTASRRHPPRGLLVGQKALVTGASSGIGKAVALRLAAEGADVAVNYRSQPDPAHEVVEAIRAMGREAIAVEADVSSEDDVRRMFGETCDALGTVDVLVNNAGLQRDAAVAEMTLEQWNTVIGVNLTGQFLCAREALREFRRRGVVESVSCAAGKIVAVSSVHELIPWAGHANYAASKGGVMLLVRSLAQEVAAEKIRVNSVCPGAIRTPINTDAWETPEAHARLMELIPYDRIGEPDDVARAVAWLASDDSDYVNGASLFVDGGMALYPAFKDNG